MNTEVIDADVQTLKLEKLTISKPRKTDDSLFGKISYDGCQLNLHLNNVQVIKHKKIKHMSKFYTVLQLQVSRQICKKLVEFDAHCIEQVQTNTVAWFTKTLDENVIEEYYTSSVNISKTSGFMFKLKLQGDDDILESNKLDIVIGLKGLRFYKQRFIPEWEIVSTTVIDSDFMNSLDSDSEACWEEDINNQNTFPEPDDEEFNQIFHQIRSKITDHVNRLSQDRDILSIKLEELDKLNAELEKCKNSISALDRISDIVENYNYTD